MRDSELDIATIIDGAALGVTPGYDLFAGPIPTGAPDRFVVCRYTTGEKDGVIGEAEGSGLVYQNTIQVLVRGNRQKYKETLDLAAACFETLTHPGQGQYLYMCSVGAGPSYLGPDETGRHTFTFDVETQYESTSSSVVVALSPDNFILRSPNGNRWRVTVSNAGALVVTAI